MRTTRITKKDPKKEKWAKVLRHLVLFALALLITIPAVSCAKGGKETTDENKAVETAADQKSQETAPGEAAATVNGKIIPMI